MKVQRWQQMDSLSGLPLINDATTAPKFHMDQSVSSNVKQAFRCMVKDHRAKQVFSIQVGCRAVLMQQLFRPLSVNRPGHPTFHQTAYQGNFFIMEPRVT
jgi:hypothetical protein